MFFLKKILKSFFYAFRGIKTGFGQRNFVAHIIVAVYVVLFGVFFQISTLEWVLVLLCIGLVLSSELFNTSIEETCNLLNRRLKLNYSDTTIIRDLSAGAVLITAIISAIVGLIIFIPKVFF